MSLTPHPTGGSPNPPDPRDPDGQESSRNPSRNTRGSEPAPGLASMLDAMRGRMADAPHGVTLTLEPLRPWDALDAWRSLASDEAVATLIIFPAPGSAIADGAGSAGVTALATEFNERHRVADTIDGRTGVQTEHLEQGAWLIAIEGVVEPADAVAIERAIDLGLSPLEAEVRAVAAIRITGGRVLEAHARQREIAEIFIAQAFRRYLAHLRGSAVASIASPDAGLLARLTDRYDEFIVRPIETEVFSTSVDIGITRLDETGAILPADHSFIYDVFSNTWHGE
jgi:hypothetical protein